MTTPTSRFTLAVVVVLAIAFTAGCLDEVAVTLDKIETVQQDVLALLEEQARTTAATATAAGTGQENARTALENSGMVLNDNENYWSSKDPTSHRSCGLIFPTVAEGKDPLCSAWKDAQKKARRARIQAEADQRVVNDRTTRYAQRLDALRRTYEDDTWDAIALARTGNPSASARSIVITYLRELEDERERLENLAAESQP